MKKTKILFIILILLESTVEVRDYIMKKLVEGGYEWIE